MDKPTLFDVKIVRAKKIHKCIECWAEISIGDEYEYCKGLWEGEWAYYKTCLECSELRYKVRDIYDEFPPFGELKEWEREAEPCGNVSGG